MNLTRKFQKKCSGSCVELENSITVLQNGLQVRDEVYYGAPESAVKLLTDGDRLIFFIIFTILLTVAVVGNLAAIYATIKKKSRFIQKTYTISLALSDMLMAVVYSINNLETFSHPLINWTLGSFMCSGVPLAQMLGLTASTVAIVVIAFDRYRNVVHALTKQWDPQPRTCIACTVAIWVVCFGVSYPMARMFVIKITHIIYYDEGIPSHYERLEFCIGDKKEQLKKYYICMAVLIFSTLLIIFFWLYYNIARLVWHHRKPVSHKQSSKPEASTSMETISTQVTTNTLAPKRIAVKKTRNVHVQRKIRTFKVIIALVVVFFICRLPFWIWNIMKLIETYTKHYHWILNYTFNAIALLNCALDPFLYTFLDPTLKVLDKVFSCMKNCFCDVCCCLCSTSEFESFEKENPFVYDKKWADERASSSRRSIRFEDEVKPRRESKIRF